MKIAVANDQGMVTQHFGHCESFLVFDVEDGKIVKSETVANPGHRPGFLPNFLKDIGVQVIISGGMGGGAIALFEENDVEVVVGASGDATAAAQAFVDGELVSTGGACKDHGYSPGQ